jgi:hypothetical protein
MNFHNPKHLEGMLFRATICGFNWPIFMYTSCLNWSISWIWQNNVFWSGKIAFKHVINNIFLNKWWQDDNNNNSDYDNDGEHYFWPLLKIDYFYKYIISMWSLIRNLSENVKESHITQTMKMVECYDFYYYY